MVIKNKAIKSQSITRTRHMQFVAMLKCNCNYNFKKAQTLILCIQNPPPAVGELKSDLAVSFMLKRSQVSKV